MYRILVGAVLHESNTFWPYPTDLQSFKNRNFYLGDEVTEKFNYTKTALGGFYEVLREEGAEAIPCIAALAEPSGTVTADAFNRIKQEIVDSCKKVGKLDGILLYLHGAMVTEVDEDGDGNLLEAIREVVGYDIPVMTTLDLHVNMTKKMIRNATAFMPYRSYPHSDMYERGLDAARLMMKTLKGEAKPVMCWKPIPLMPVLTETAKESFKPIADVLAEIFKDPKVFTANFNHGFYLSDTSETHAAAMVVTDGDEALAQSYVDKIASVAWENREALTTIERYSPEEAIELAYKTEGKGPVVLADICDNPGAGYSGDNTYLLRALIKANAQKVAYAMICDPETLEQCHKAGVGSYIDIKLGGKMLPDQDSPIECRAYVKGLFDGQYVNRGPMHGGLTVNVKKSAVIVIGGISVILLAVCTQCYDIEIFQAHGMQLDDFDILVVKSSIHYRAAFGPRSKRMISVESPGGMPLSSESLTYKRLTRPIYPLDEVDFK